MNRNGIPGALIVLCGIGFCPATFAQSAGALWVRHAPVLNGRVEGSVQVMTAENVALNGDAVVTGDLLVPGTPSVRINGHPCYGGTVDGTGAVTPDRHQITLNGHANLRHVIRRTDPLTLPTIVPPALPTGWRCVSLSRRGQSPGDFSSLRNLTVNGSAGMVAVPPGRYDSFSANSRAGFVLGTAGAAASSVYDFQSLALNSNSSVDVVGPVVVTVGGSFALNGGSTIGNGDHPEWLRLRVSGGGLTVNGNSRVCARLESPSGTVTLNGRSALIGTVVADRLIVNGDSLLRFAAATPNQPPAVALTAPPMGSTYYAPAVITLVATASDSDGTVAQVEFFQGTTKLGEDTTAPYEIAWTGVPAGSYALTAVATDNAGAAATSLPVGIAVATPLNRPPAVAITSPDDGAAFIAPANIRLEADAADPDGIVAKVEYYSGANKLGEAAAVPFACDWLNVAPGGYALTARATDNAGAVSISVPVTVSVATGMPFATDFELAEGYLPGPLNGQGGWITDGASLVTAADAQQGDQSVVLPGRAPPVWIAHAFPASDEGTVTFVDFQALLAAGADTESDAGYATDAAKFTLVQSNGAGALWVFAGDGSGGGAWEATGAVIAVDTETRATDWHRLTIRADYAAKKWDLYLDGAMAAAEVGFLDASRAALSSFAASGHRSASTLLDSFAASFDNPLFADADKDGMPDAWETASGLDPTVNDRGGDRDGDGVTNLREFLLGTRADRADTDGDGLPDGWELAHHLNPRQAAAPADDADQDGLSDLLEFGAGTDPSCADTDGDGMPDGWEVVNGLDPLLNDAAADADSDGVSNLQEYVRGTKANDYYNGVLPQLASLVPEGQVNTDGSLSLRVTDAAGLSLAGAPVTFTAIEGGHRLAARSGAPGVLELQVRTDTEGVAKVFVVGEGN